MTEIYLLEQLVAFSQTGTLSGAAQLLHTSQPALTRSMKKLEEELGVQLFNRGKNHIEFNETGKVAAEYAARVLREDEYFRERVISYDRSLHTLQIGYCAPIPQRVLTPLINSVFDGMTISADMTDDRDFLTKLETGIYQLAVVHEEPSGKLFYSKKCGHEDLYISLRPSDPLAFYPEIHMEDLDGRSILLLSRIGFWKSLCTFKTPHSRYLVQIDEGSFNELARNSEYPSFSSSYYLGRGQKLPGRINVALADAECHSDYYLVCLWEQRQRYRQLFEQIHENTVR